MFDIKFRLAKPSDAGRIAEIQQKIKEVNNFCIFVVCGVFF